MQNHPCLHHDASYNREISPPLVFTLRRWKTAVHYEYPNVTWTLLALSGLHLGYVAEGVEPLFKL